MNTSPAPVTSLEDAYNVGKGFRSRLKSIGQEHSCSLAQLRSYPTYIKFASMHPPEYVVELERGFMEGYEDSQEKSPAYTKSYQTGQIVYDKRKELNNTCNCGKDHRLTLEEYKQTDNYMLISLICSPSQDQVEGFDAGYQAAWNEDHNNDTNIISKSV